MKASALTKASGMHKVCLPLWNEAQSTVQKMQTLIAYIPNTTAGYFRKGNDIV